MIQKNLSQRALLVGVNISMCTFRKKDKRATATANTAHNADSSAGSYNKKLLPGALELAAVETVVGQARKYVLEQTLPWLADGTRILAAKNYLDFVAGINLLKGQFEDAVREFDIAYPRLRGDAASRLGDLYNAKEYPLDIASRFSFDVTYLPMPDAGDFRTAVSDTARREFEDKMKAVESTAMREAWSRIHAVVKSAAEKLASPGAIFRDSLLANVTDMAALLPSLNITDDAELDSMAKEVTTLVSKLSPDTLRINAGERDKASKALSEIESRMGAFMGGVK